MVNNVNPNVGNRNWTQFVIVENGKIISLSDAPLFYRTESGERPTDEWLVAEGFRGYVYTSPPEYNQYEEKLVQTPIEKLKITSSNNTVVQTWSVIPLTAAEKQQKNEELKISINRERELRISLGANVSVNGIGSIPIRGTDDDMRNITNLGQLANLYITNGINSNISFRDDLNVMHTLTPQQMSELWQKTVAYVSSIYQSSWNMKEMNPLPQDYADNKYWPSRNI